MIKHICPCGYIYNSKYGDINSDIEKGITFDELPDTWVCPFCGLGKEKFVATEKKSRMQFSLK